MDDTIHAAGTISDQAYADAESRFVRELMQGLGAAADVPIRGGGIATTNLYSPWLCDLCSICGHSFRVGDRVVVESGGAAKHCSSALPCAGGVSEVPPDPEVNGFFRGLSEAWLPQHDVPVVRLEEGHDLVASPEGGFRRHTCAVCGHTFRRHDHVVICPCSPHAPKCPSAVHRDIIHGLLCYDGWDPAANGLKVCPITMIELDGN